MQTTPASSISVLTDILRTLSGFSSPRNELSFRLAFNVDSTGPWLDDLVESGALFRTQKPVFPGSQPDRAGALERCTTVNDVGDLLFAGTDKYDALQIRARLSVFESAALIIRAADIRLAVDLLRRAASWVNRVDLGKAWVGLSRVTSWAEIGLQLLDYAAVRDLGMVAHELPWEHWSICDNFLSEGGLVLVQRLLARLHHVESIFAGWALVELIRLHPESTELIEIASRFYAEHSKKKESGLDEQMAHVLAMSEEFCAQNTELRDTVLEKASKDRLLCRILAAASHESDMRAACRERIARQHEQGDAVGGSLDVDDLRDLIVCFRVANRQLPFPSVAIDLLQKSNWKLLPELAEVLSPIYWTSEDWTRLLMLLRAGGYRGKPRSWLANRLKLIADAMDYEASRTALLSDSAQDVGFLRHLIIDALGHGDGALANNAAYGLLQLTLHMNEGADAIAVSSAIKIGGRRCATWRGARCRICFRLRTRDQQTSFSTAINSRRCARSCQSA